MGGAKAVHSVHLGPSATAWARQRTSARAQPREQRAEAANTAFNVLSYAPETKDLTLLDGGWGIEWRSFAASYVDSPGGEVKRIRGTGWRCGRSSRTTAGRSFAGRGDRASYHQQGQWFAKRVVSSWR